MSTLKTTNLQHASATSPAIVLAADGTATAQLSSINGGAFGGTRNRIINGDMRIDQRNAGASVSGNSAFPVDRFSIGVTGSGVFSAARSTVAPPGFANSIALTVTTADTSVTGTDVYTIYQRIEGNNLAGLNFGTASATSFTLSFWVRSSVTGTYCVRFANGGYDRSYIASYSIAAANTWEYKTLTLTADTAGTWLSDTGIGIAVEFCVGNGTTYQSTGGSWLAGNFVATSSQTNWISTNGATFYITGVQLEAGSVATPFERRSYGQELALCQRYYQQSNPLVAASSLYSNAVGSAYMVGWNYSGTNGIVGSVRLPVIMRAAPTVSIYTQQGQTTAAGKLNFFQGTWTTADAGLENIGVGSFNVNSTNAGSTGSSLIQFNYAATAEL